MKISVINGPNINMLGIREPKLYGNTSYDELCQMIYGHCKDVDIEVEIFQSNHEGALCDKIQQLYRNTDGIVLNAGAYTHTSIAIFDALEAVQIPTVEVHITNPDMREDFRKVNYIRNICVKSICGHGVRGYIEAVDYLFENYGKKK